MANSLNSLVGHRLTINPHPHSHPKPYRPPVGPPMRPPMAQTSDANNAFLRQHVFSNSNPQRHEISDPFRTFNMNQISHQPNKPRAECRCDPEFVNFCKLHTISHSNCAITRQVCCQLCNTSADFKSIQWHLNTEKHKQRHQQLMEYVFLLSIPNYSRSQVIKITELLDQVYHNISLSKTKFELRVKAVDRLNQLMKDNGLTDYTLRMYGSTVTRTSTNNGFALKESDLNLDIVYAENVDKKDKNINTLPLVLADLLDLVQKNSKDMFDDIRKDFNLKQPKLRFRFKDYDLMVEVSITCAKSYRLSKLLQQYCEIDDRVSKLGIVFREWARIYGFDDQENGLWPSFTFPILVIHYLQQCTPPVLPCLHELMPKNPAPNPTKEETQINSQANKLILEDNETVEDIFNLKGLNWQKMNNKSIGELWLDMLRYYSVQFNTEKNVVSIRTTKPVRTHEDKHWGTLMMAVEDPARPSLNLSRSVGSMKLFNTFMEQLRFTYKYFWIPFIEAPVYSGTLNVKPLFTERDFDVLANQTHRYVNFDMCDLSTQIDQIQSAVNELDHKNQNQRTSDDSDSDDESKRKENFHSKANRLLKTFGIWMELFPDLRRTAQLLPSSQLSYTFALNRMPFFQRPQKFCRHCHRYNHLQSVCPEQELPLLKNLPEKLDFESDQTLTIIFNNVYLHNRMNENDLKIQTDILADLENYIKRELPNAKLDLFGSTRNGFGARHCDYDICLTFSDNQTGEGLDMVKILEQVIELLRFNANLTDIQGILTAKVPIVKFNYRHAYGLAVCDISMYNILAVHNTHLLSTYTKIDPRVGILGFIVKHFAKVCDMCDASRGSLSSYAYTLMTIHYLQQKGIIPVLQEIGLELKTERIVEGWDTWFFSDLSILNQYWNPIPNNESVAQLFFGFLRYYSEIFNFEDRVICCRQSAPLSRLEKYWTGCKIAIEDPFLLTHNLGAGVSSQMAVFIKTALIKGRNHFGSKLMLPLDANRYRDLNDYYFNRHNLTNGLPPTGRGCRQCGKIGHKQNMCPEKRQKRDTRERFDNRDRHERPGRRQATDKSEFRIITANRQDRNARNNVNSLEDGYEKVENFERKDRTDRNKSDRNERQERHPIRTDNESMNPKLRGPLTSDTERSAKGHSRRRRPPRH